MHRFKNRCNYVLCSFQEKNFLSSLYCVVNLRVYRVCSFKCPYCYCVPFPSCFFIECNFPASPSNGDVSVKDTISGTVAEYTCYTNYSLSGTATRVCQDDGTGWTGTEPICGKRGPTTTCISLLHCKILLMKGAKIYSPNSWTRRQCPCSLTILKNILCLILQDSLNLEVTEFLIDLAFGLRNRKSCYFQM